VRYQYLSSILLNEVQKQYRAAQAQAELIQTQQQRIAALEQRIAGIESLLAQDRAEGGRGARVAQPSTEARPTVAAVGSHAGQ
jgi:hypothetical protein